MLLMPVLAAWLLLVPFAGAQEPPAQIPLDEFTAKGAVKLTGAELQALVSGAAVKGYLTTGGFSEWEAKPDGTADGFSQVPTGQCTLAGKWRINEKDELCWHGWVTCNYNYNRPYGGCSAWYRLGANYYTVQSGTALLRVVRRQ